MSAAESIKLQLTQPALERLFSAVPEAEIILRKQACREIVNKHFKELANEELWRLSHAMTESIAEEVRKVVDGYQLGDRDPTGRWRWYLQYPTSERVDDMIANACKKYLTDRVEAMAQKTMESMVVGTETFEQMVERTAKRIVRTRIEEAVTKEVNESIDRTIQKAVSERSITLKVVPE
jgi:hypothetical protein